MKYSQHNPLRPNSIDATVVNSLSQTVTVIVPPPPTPEPLQIGSDFPAPALIGQLFFNTSRSKLYVYTGSEPAGWAAAADRAVSVDDFGAAGSGADDTVAVQAAMDYCGATGIELIFNKVYSVTGLVQVNNLTCRGVNGGGLISYSVATQSGTLTGQHLIHAENKSNFHWIDMLLDTSVNTRIVSGLRTLNCFNSSNYSIRGCQIKTGGAAVASVNCQNYLITDNRITIQSTWTDVQHDGVIDQWWGSHDFCISNNSIESGNLTGRWPILVTGTSGAPVSPTPCYNFSITGNTIRGFIYAGIWSQGRSGGCSNVVISGNYVDGDSKSIYSPSSIGAGIAVTETQNCIVSDNIIKNTAGSGIRISSEPGWSVGHSAQLAISVTGNVVISANSSGTAGAPGSGILIQDDCQFVNVGANTVIGTQHTYPLFINGNSTEVGAITLSPGAYQSGVSGGPVINGNLPNTGGMWVNDGKLEFFSNGVRGMELRRGTAGNSLYVRGQTTETQDISIGIGRTGNGTSQINLYPDSSGSPKMIFRAYGSSTIREIRSVDGPLQIVAENSSDIIINTKNVDNHVRLAAGGRVGINGYPNSSAALDVNSTTGGLLLPRLTTAQRDLIAAPQAGLLIYNTTTQEFEARHAGGWSRLALYT